MPKYSEQQNGLAIVMKKLAQARNRQEAFEIVSKEMSASSPESLIDELARWLLHLRSALRAGTFQNKTGMSALIEVSGEIAKAKGIPLSRFFPVLLEKILVEETVETVTLPSRPSAKERILEAALEIFSQKGFHPATMDEIAEKAGVGKGTLYRYFETKEKLFAELVRLRLDELERRAGSVMDGQDDVLTMISKYIRVYFEFFDGNQRLLQAHRAGTARAGRALRGGVLQKSHAGHSSSQEESLRRNTAGYSQRRGFSDGILRHDGFCARGDTEMARPGLFLLARR